MQIGERLLLLACQWPFENSRPLMTIFFMAVNIAEDKSQDHYLEACFQDERSL